MKNDPYEMNNLYPRAFLRKQERGKYAAVIKELKTELLRLRNKYNETDDRYPHIQKVIDEYWDS